MKKSIPGTVPLNRLNFPVHNRDHIQGNIEAPVTLLEYGDYECPACSQAYPIVKAVQLNMGNSLCFAFRNFPLTPMHPHAAHAAEAAEAAGAQGRFWEMHNLLFENQKALEDEDLAGYAIELHLDVRFFIAQIATGAFSERVREDVIAGFKSEVSGTPAFFINGRPYDGPHGYARLRAALAATGR